jgi:hypothetical protein
MNWSSQSFPPGQWRRPDAARIRSGAMPAKARDELAGGTPGKGLIHPQQVAKAVSDQAAGSENVLRSGYA